MIIADLLSTVRSRLEKDWSPRFDEYTLTWYNAAGTVVQSRSRFNLLAAKLFNWNFTGYLKLCLADAIHNFQLVKIIRIEQNIGHQFCKILLFDVTC